MHKGWVDSGTKESGVQTRSPQGLWTRGQTEGEGLSQSRNRWPVTLTCVQNPPVPPTDTGDPGFPKYHQAKHA